MGTLAELRRNADAALKDQRWRDAMGSYAKLEAAADYDGKDATFMGNFGLASLQAEAYPSACRWASEAIKLGGTAAYFIRGSAMFEIAVRRPNIRIRELRYAQQDLRRVVKLFPDDAPGWKKLEECDGFIADLEQNPPDFFPLVLRDTATQPELVRSRRRIAFLDQDFEIIHKTTRKRFDIDWMLHGSNQKLEHGVLEYVAPPGDVADDPDAAVGKIYVENRDGKFPGGEAREFIAVWRSEGSDEAHEESFELRSIGEIVIHHLGEARLLGFGPSADEFCLLEPDDYSSKTSLVKFDASTFWTVATFWKALATTGVKPWDEEIGSVKASGIPVWKPEDQPTQRPLISRDAAQISTSIQKPKTPMDLKASGNEFFKKKLWQEAIDSYEAALKCCGVTEGNDIYVALHSNLAQCYLNLELYRRAVDAATACLQIDWRNQKALFRRSRAYEKLRQHQEALTDLDSILKTDPGHKEAQDAKQRLQQLVQDRRQKPSSKVGVPVPEAGSTEWCEGLAARDRYEWFVDCYRLRLDDDCTASDHPAERGLYMADAKRGTILEDWLAFCKLALSRDILPMDWSWQAVLDVASQRLSNFLSADVLAGRADNSAGKWRSMRGVAQLVYGERVESDGVREEVKKALRAVDPHLFDDYGGPSAWQQLMRKIPDPQLMKG